MLFLPLVTELMKRSCWSGGNVRRSNAPLGSSMCAPWQGEQLRAKIAAPWAINFFVNFWVLGGDWANAAAQLTVRTRANPHPNTMLRNISVLSCGSRARDLRVDLAGGFGVDLDAQVGNELVERARTQVTLEAMPDRDGARFGFFPADDQHIGNFFELRVADLGLQLFVAVIEMRSQTGFFELGCDLLGVLAEFSADRKHGGLHRSEPGGKRAGIVFDEHAEEALD